MASSRTLAVDRTRWLLLAHIDRAKSRGELACSGLAARLWIIDRAITATADKARAGRKYTRRIALHHGMRSPRRQLVHLALAAAEAYARELAGDRVDPAFSGNCYRRELIRAEW